MKMYFCLSCLKVFITFEQSHFCPYCSNRNIELTFAEE